MAEASDDVFEVDGVDDLYGLEPSEFTAARNDLVKRLRKDGDRGLADSVKKLSRPTVAAWAVNQVARSQKDDIDELIALGERVREAQVELLEGGTPSALREVSDERRRLVQRLADRGAEHAGENHRDDIAATLEAASLDPELVDRLRHGRLENTLEPPSGFDFAGMPEETTAQSRRRKTRDARRRLEQELDDATSALEKAEERQRRAESRRDDARAALERAERAVGEAEADVASAREEVESVRQALDDLDG